LFTREISNDYIILLLVTKSKLPPVVPRVTQALRLRAT